MEDVLHEGNKRRLNVSGVLRILGVSRSGYITFKKRLPSDMYKRKEAIKAQIKKVYDDSYQNYGAPKISQILIQNGETIAEKTVGNYMREMGIKAQYIKPYTVTTTDSNFSLELKNILNEDFNPEEPNAVWCSDITYIWTYEGFAAPSQYFLTVCLEISSRWAICRCDSPSI